MTAAERTAVRPVRTPADAVDLAVGYARSVGVLRKHGRTFYFMSMLFSPPRALAIAAIYRFARTVDDLVDEPPPGTPPRMIPQLVLDEAAKLEAALRGNYREPEYRALHDTILRYRLPRYPFHDLVDGVLMDVERDRYDTFAELERYCYGVAGTIGLLISPVMDARGRGAEHHAKTLGTAFQLTNVLRDVGEDARRGRIYLPREDLERFRVTEAEILQGRLTPAFRALMEFQIQRAMTLYEDGAALLPLVPLAQGRLGFRFAIDAYSGILRKIRENGYDALTRRAYLSGLEKAALVPRALRAV